jgi:hypothetical protein
VAGIFSDVPLKFSRNAKRRGSYCRGTSAQIGSEQAAGESATDENKFRWQREILNRESAFAPGCGATGYVDITDFQIKQLAQNPARTQSIVV